MNKLHLAELILAGFSVYDLHPVGICENIVLLRVSKEPPSMEEIMGLAPSLHSVRITPQHLWTKDPEGKLIQGKLRTYRTWVTL